MSKYKKKKGNKGNTTVLMDKLEYSEKLASQASNDNYNKVKNSIWYLKSRESSHKYWTKTLITSWLRITIKYHTHRFTQIHKDGILLKSKVSCWGSACHPLSQFLVGIINPLIAESVWCEELLIL